MIRSTMRGQLHAWGETGTEGFVWALQEDGFETDKDQWSYDGLRIVERGDHLKIFDTDGKVLFEGIVRPKTKPTIGRYRIHWVPDGVDPVKWWNWFNHDPCLRAELIKRGKNSEGS